MQTKTTQTSPELLHKYYQSQSFNTPSEPETIRTKTVAVIQTTNDFDESRNKIREIFTIQNRSKSGEGVKYIQISEYKTDFGSNEPVVKVHESVVLANDERKNLTHSTVELTEVTDNTTTVAEYPFDDDINSFNTRYQSSNLIKSKPLNN